MKQFKNKPNGFKEVKRQLLIRTVPLMLMSIAVGLGLTNFNTNNMSNVNVLPMVIPIALLSVGYGLWLSIKRQKDIYLSYTLSIDQESLNRIQNNTPTINIMFKDVKKIIKSKGAYTVTGKSFANSILISSQIENQEELEKTLSEICTITEVEKASILKKLIYPLAAFLSFGLMIIVFVAYNKVLLATSGILLVGILIWSFISMQSKNIDNKTRRAGYFTIVVMLVVLGNVIKKLMM